MNNGILKLKDKERTFSRGTVKKDAFRGFGGVTHRIRMKVNRRIGLTRLGFLGPHEANGYYEVTIVIETVPDWRIVLDHKKIGVYAKKGEMFYIEFDGVFTLEANKYYSIGFMLNGPKTGVLELKNWRSVIQVEDNSTVFYFLLGSRQLAELKYVLLDK